MLMMLEVYDLGWMDGWNAEHKSNKYAREWLCSCAPCLLPPWQDCCVVCWTPCLAGLLCGVLNWGWGLWGTTDSDGMEGQTENSCCTLVMLVFDATMTGLGAITLRGWLILVLRDRVLHKGWGFSRFCGRGCDDGEGDHHCGHIHKNTHDCEKCDWMTGKPAGQNFHENRAKFDQKSPFNLSLVRASGDRDPLASLC